MLSVDLLRTADAKDIISYYRPRPDAAGLIDVPNVIPIEILNVDENTNLKKSDTEKPENKNKETITKQKKFNSSDQLEVKKNVEINKTEIEEKTNPNQPVLEMKQTPNLEVKETKKVVIKEKEILEVKKKVETIKTDIIKPKLKPKPKIINNEINFTTFDSSTKIKNDQKEKYQYEDGFQLNETTQFEISKDFSNISEYYQAHNYEKFVSLDLDNNDHNNYLSKNNFFEKLGVEKQFISSLLDLIGEEQVGKPRHPEKENINQMDNLPKNQILNNFESIDKSLENLLLNLSYNINQELFKANLIKKMISKDSFDYLLGKNFMIRHPYPFVINFEFNLK